MAYVLADLDAVDKAILDHGAGVAVEQTRFADGSAVTYLKGTLEEKVLVRQRVAQWLVAAGLLVLPAAARPLRAIRLAPRSGYW